MYLSSQNLTILKGRAWKLVPKYVGPPRIVAVHPETSNYTLDLPQIMRDWRIHPKFHVSLLRRHEPNDDALFPTREAKAFYDIGAHEETEWEVDEIVGHRWVANKVEISVRWTLGDTTWEPYKNCAELSALDAYLTLMGVTDWRKLPRKERLMRPAPEADSSGTDPPRRSGRDREWRRKPS